MHVYQKHSWRCHIFSCSANLWSWIGFPARQRHKSACFFRERVAPLFRCCYWKGRIRYLTWIPSNRNDVWFAEGRRLLVKSDCKICMVIWCSQRPRSALELFILKNFPTIFLNHILCWRCLKNSVYLHMIVFTICQKLNRILEMKNTVTANKEKAHIVYSYIFFCSLLYLSICLHIFEYINCQ